MSNLTPPYDFPDKYSTGSCKRTNSQPTPPYFPVNNAGSSKPIKLQPTQPSPEHPTGEAEVQVLYNWSALSYISAHQPTEVLSTLCSAILLLLGKPRKENSGEIGEETSSALRENGITLCLEVCKKHLSSLDFFFENLRHRGQICSFARSTDTTNRRHRVLHFVIAYALQKLKCPAQLYQKYLSAAERQYLLETLAVVKAREKFVDSQTVVCGLLVSRCLSGTKEDSRALMYSLLCKAWCKAWGKESEGFRLDEMLKESLVAASCCVAL
jgi:hypothetical protein